LTEIADELVRWHTGDRAAQEALVRRALRISLRTAAAITRDREQANEVAQEVAVEVLRSAKALRSPEAYGAWVHKITVRRSIKWIRRHRQQAATQVPLALAGDLADRDGLDDVTGAIDARRALASALAHLPDRQRLALALRYVHDLDDEAIASALGCRKGTVHALLSRGRSALRSDPRLRALRPAISEGTSR
jgi:RNA polymerase sigma factor (sigma-70 family)